MNDQGSGSLSPGCFYKGYYLSAMTTESDDAQYRARVVIMAPRRRANTLAALRGPGPV
jgi:hypothetical protein